LSLQGCELTDACVAVIIDFQTLRTIDLRYSRISEDGLEKLRARFPDATVSGD
jgi:hypothetical protein